MRVLVLADVHSNLSALQAVIADAEGRGGFDSIWCLGDTVGYGPDPTACLQILRQHDLLMVAGNHDHAAVGERIIETFNGAAAEAALWTHGQLSEEETQFLRQLPLAVTVEPFTLVHGSLRAPLMEYVLDQESAIGSLELLTTRFCLVGHSHIPFVCMENQGAPQFVEFTLESRLRLGEERWIINPGGVGQPRDRDPRASYAVYDNEPMTIERHRVEYDIEDTQDRMRRANLPQRLIERLAHGV